MARENYYLLLGLDPDKDLSWAVIEPKFKKQRDTWAQQSTLSPYPEKRAAFKENLKIAKDIEQVLKDDALRKQEAEEAKVLLAKKKAEGAAELDSLVRLTGAKGYLTPDDVKSLVKGGKWSEAEVLAAAGRASLTIKKPVVVAPKDRLDKSLAEEIDKGLKFLNKDGKGATNLYEFLGSPRSASTKVLHKKATDEYEEVRKTANKDETVGIRQNLYGKCMDVFRSDKDRERYDNTLAWQELAEIRRLAEQAGGGEKKLSGAVMAQLIIRGKKEGLTQQEVEQTIDEVTAGKGWKVEVPGTNAVPATLQRCGYCFSVAAPEKTHCGGCGRPLKVACPKCTTPAPSDARVCGKCSFSIGDMPLADSLIRSAKGAMATDPAAARAALTQALTFHPSHPEASELLTRLTDREKEIRRHLDAIDLLRADRKYNAARTKIDEFASHFSSHASVGTLRKEAADAIAAAAGHVQRAKSLQASGKMDDAIDAFTEAVGVCADYKEAVDGLARCPPDPATNATATALPTGIVLKWNVSPSRGKLVYRVVRKAGSQPTCAEDGEEVGRVVAATLMDDKAEPGRLYYYAVFTERGGVGAARAAAVGPVVRVADVTGLGAIVGSGKVELQWQSPPNARRVEVWRKQGSVSARGIGTSLNTVFGSTATDTGLTNGVPYGYRVVAVFGGPDGKDVFSEGAGIVAIPVAPPQPVTGLKVVRTGQDAFEVTWDPPKTGEVRIYRLLDPKSAVYRPGEQVPVNDLDRVGVRVPAAGPCAARDRLENLNALHILPVTMLGQAAVVGAVVTENWVDDIERLKAWADGETVRATWDFPNGFDAVVVVTRIDQFPDGPEDVAAQRTVWTREQARLNGGFRLSVPKADQVFLIVYTQVNRDGRLQYSTGQRTVVAVGTRRRVRYSFRRQRRWMLATGAWEVVLTPDAATTLPELLLIASPDRLPLAPTHGNELMRIDSEEADPKHPLIIEFEAPSWFDPRRARLFPWADDDNRWLELLGG